MSAPVGTISRRVAAISESATMALDQRVKQLRANGEEVISFGAGEPDFPTGEAAVEAAVRACRDPSAHHYTPAAGLPELRAAIAAKTERDSRRQVEAAQVLVTNGTKQAVAHAFAVLLDPGDEVLIPAPYWVTFPEAVRIAGGVPVEVPTHESTGFRAGVEDLERRRTPHTKALLFNSPANPTGAVYGEAQMKAIGDWALERGLWVVCDEIYEPFTYAGAVFNSLATVVPELAPRCLCLSGVAKAYAMTGWRVGWMVGDGEVVAAAVRLQSQVCGNISNVSQYAALAALRSGLEPVRAMAAAFARRRDRIVDHLAAIPGFECPPPEGAFYAFPSVAGALGRTVSGRRLESSAELASLLLEEARVAVVPGEAFGAPGYLRFSYALSDQQLEEGMERVHRLLA